ncbi:MAG: S1 family peptidase [Thermodesulfovibrionales bacterium]
MNFEELMKPNKSRLRAVLTACLLLVVSSFLLGCMSATKVVMNEKVEMKTQDYGELYFLKPAKDPRNVVPQVIEEFKSMGFNVKEVEQEKPIEGAQGTGFLISDEGHILTCAHVVGDEQTATVWVADARYEADVVDKDKDADIALIKIRGKISSKYTPLSFRSDNSYKLGEDVMTIGFPMTKVLGTRARLSKGLVSSTVGQRDDPKQIQFSAEVQPGNSGGPLFDKEGVVVGVISGTLNPWKMVRTTGGGLPQNVNFAIKTDTVLNSIKSKNEAVYNKIKTNQKATVENIESAVVRVRSGIISEELEKKPKIVATLDYQSIWDMWWRFRFFVITIYDFDTQDLLFRTGQGRDNLVSNESVVIKDTMAQVRKTLNK